MMGTDLGRVLGMKGGGGGSEGGHRFGYRDALTSNNLHMHCQVNVPADSHTLRYYGAVIVEYGHLAVREFVLEGTELLARQTFICVPESYRF